MFGQKVFYLFVGGAFLISGLSAANISKSEKSLIEAVKHKNGSALMMHNSKANLNEESLKIIRGNKSASIKSKKKAKIKSTNSNYARVMVRLKPGVNPKKTFNSIIRLNSIGKKDIKLVKSFALAGVKKRIGVFSKAKKSILVIESKKLSEKKLLNLVKKIDGVDKAEISKRVKINVATPPMNIPNDEFFSFQWDMHNDGDNNGTNGIVDADIDAPEAWTRHKGYSSVVVGTIDTGIDYYHPDLKNNLWVNQAEVNGQEGVDDDGNGYVDDYYGIDTANIDSDPYDDDGHGTHVAGTIAAEGNNGLGVAGINWHAKVAACKFLDSDGYGYTDGAVECINYFNALKDAGVNIVATNNSWGGGDYSDIVHDAIQEANNRNINFVAAAGNDGDDNDDNPTYPASYDLPNVISVAASNANDELTSWSNYGETSVDLAAPGDDILSTYPSELQCIPNNDHVYFSDDFEHGTGKWNMLTVNPWIPVQDMPDKHWALDDSMAVSGSYSLSDSPDGNYSNNTLQSAVMKNGIDLSGVNTNQTICASLTIKGETEEEMDELDVLATPDNGDTWYFLGYTNSNYNDWTNISVTIPKILYSNNIKLAIVKFNDGDITTSGYNIDDTKITTGVAHAIPRYAFFSGTSMAAPHVTGALAYISKPNDKQTALERKNKILKAVDVLANLDGKVLTSGRLNLAKLDINNTKSDFNNDKIADIIWRSSNKVHLWKMDENASHIYVNLGTKSSSYNIAATIDGDSDGIADILWRKDDKVQVWNMQSDGTHNFIDLGTKSSTYDIAGVADFNGDGIADILWRKDNKVQLWEIKVDENATHNFINLGTKSSSYNVAGVADFNNDGIADIFWRKGSGNYLWLMHIDGSHTYKNIGTKSSSYTVAGVADFNNDGIADILWRKGSNNYIWYMNSDGSHSYKNIGTKSSTYTIAKIADFNGDGIADILWRKGSGIYIWYMHTDGSHTFKNAGTKSSSYIAY